MWGQLHFLGHILRKSEDELVNKYVLSHPRCGKCKIGRPKLMMSHQYTASVISEANPPLPEEIWLLEQDGKEWRKLEVDCSAVGQWLWWWVGEQVCSNCGIKGVRVCGRQGKGVQEAGFPRRWTLSQNTVLYPAESSGYSVSGWSLGETVENGMFTAEILAFEWPTPMAVTEIANKRWIFFPCCQSLTWQPSTDQGTHALLAQHWEK